VSGSVFLNYTQAELDKAYDQRNWAANAEAVIASYGTKSREVKSRLKFVTERYGASEDETLDLYPPDMPAGDGKPGAPMHVFVHGGGWRQLTKDESAFAAPAFVENGAIYVALNFAVIPKARVPEMVEQTRRAIVWLVRNAWGFGGDPERLYLSGHSSGGHMAACLLTTDWRAYGIGEAPFKAGICASGMYDLGPVMLSARSSYVKIDKAEEAALSPMRHLDRVHCPIVVAYGDAESPEFKRQARDFAAALKAKVRPKSQLVECTGMNHFEVALSLADPEGVLGKIALGQIARRG